MNKHQFDNRSLRDTASLVAVSAEELKLVAGGGILSRLKSAATWIYNHVVPGRVVPLPIKF